jgi:hypothetical protein
MVLPEWCRTKAVRERPAWSIRPPNLTGVECAPPGTGFTSQTKDAQAKRLRDFWSETAPFLVQ